MEELIIGYVPTLLPVPLSQLTAALHLAVYVCGSRVDKRTHFFATAPDGRTAAAKQVDLSSVLCALEFIVIKSYMIYSKLINIHL